MIPSNTSSRRGEVLDRLRREPGDGWVPGHELATATCGGSEGLRRLRELRELGYYIEERRLPHRNERSYRLLAEPGEPRPEPAALELWGE